MKLIFLIPLLFCLNTQIFSQSETVKTNIELKFTLPSDLPDSISNKVQLIIDFYKTEHIALAILKNSSFKPPNGINEAERKNKMPAVIEESYKSFTTEELPAVMTSMLDYYISNFSLEELQQLNSFYQTPTGKKVQELEIIKISKSIEANKKLDKIIDEKIQNAFPTNQKSKKRKK